MSHAQRVRDINDTWWKLKLKIYETLFGCMPKYNISSTVTSNVGKSVNLLFATDRTPWPSYLDLLRIKTVYIVNKQWQGHDKFDDKYSPMTSPWAVETLGNLNSNKSKTMATRPELQMIGWCGLTAMWVGGHVRSKFKFWI